MRCIVVCCTVQHRCLPACGECLMVPLHDTIRSRGALRLPCTSANRNVWHVSRMAWHRRYFLNREPPYWLQSSVTGSAFRGFGSTKEFHVIGYTHVSKQHGRLPVHSYT